MWGLGFTVLGGVGFGAVVLVCAWWLSLNGERNVGVSISECKVLDTCYDSEVPNGGCSMHAFFSCSCLGTETAHVKQSTSKAVHTDFSRMYSRNR